MPRTQCCQAVQQERIANSELDELVVTNTIPLNDDTRNCKKIRQLSAAGILAETIRRISTEDLCFFTIYGLTKLFLTLFSGRGKQIFV